MLIAPLDTDMSAAAKSLVASLEVNVSESVASLEVNPVLPCDAVIVIVGLVSSCVHANWVAAAFAAPAASEYPPAPTSMVHAPSAVGVNVAV